MGGWEDRHTIKILPTYKPKKFWYAKNRKLLLEIKLF